MGQSIVREIETHKLSLFQNDKKVRLVHPGKQNTSNIKKTHHG